MSDIVHPIQFTAESQRIITAKTNDPNFDHTCWADPSLASIRKEIRNYYRQKQKGLCSFCKNELSVSSALNCHVEHIAPKAKYPHFIFTPTNLCVICSDCNTNKRDQEVHKYSKSSIIQNKRRVKYPKSASSFLIVHPHFDNYEEHILIVGSFYVDKGSRKGNYTIGICNLNRRLGTLGYRPFVY